MTLNIPDKLKELERIFDSYGYELCFVGGCVRDTLMGIAHKDIDLATSATPEEQIELYKTNNIHYIETGLQHGTLTVMLDGEPYEITTYRIDQETDGRHAAVEFTRSLYDDLFRRDLTVNAIAMDFNGNIFDPFNGVVDIVEGVVRFVGDAEDRIQEDYLRILRFFRFFGRISKRQVTVSTREAIYSNRNGLKNISVERVWSEMAKIVSGPMVADVLTEMQNADVLSVIGIDTIDIDQLVRASMFTSDPAVLMTYLLNANVVPVSEKWKWANEEKRRAKFILSRADSTYTLEQAKFDLFSRVSRDLVGTVLKVQGNSAALEDLREWDVPVFPVSGDDLILRGMDPGIAMGRMLRNMCVDWIASDYTMSKDELLNNWV